MHADVAIRRFHDLAATPELIAGIDAVFFDASNTTSFKSDAHRRAFRERWLGRYLEHDGAWAYVALDAKGAVAGYLVASLDDPATTPRFSDIAYFADFKDLTKHYPAHFHVNLAREYRGSGLGARLIGHIAGDARAAGVPGIHVVTSRGARNTGFYERNGFHEAGATGDGVREVVFLARKIGPGA